MVGAETMLFEQLTGARSQGKRPASPLVPRARNNLVGNDVVAVGVDDLAD
jgi:hypothetical protein